MEKILGSTIVREKGEITIPKSVRDLLGIKKGDEISLVWEDGHLMLKRERKTCVDFEFKK